MRILSRHHDYYDWVAGYGVNPQIVYPREPLSVPIGHDTLPWPMDLYDEDVAEVHGGEYQCVAVTIGIYPEIYRRWMSILRRRDATGQVRVFDSLDEARAHGEALGVPAPRRRYGGWRPEARPEGRVDDARWRLVGAPIFSVCPIGWRDQRLQIACADAPGWYTTDPILSDLRFTDVPAQDVFQRIQTFLRLDPPPPDEFGDALKLKARGFDARSFRHRKPRKT